MGKNCNLELRLYSDHLRHCRLQESSDETPQRKQNQQQMAIFYDGRVCVSDVTELQARAILLLASRETEQKLRSPTGSDTSSPSKITLESHRLFSPPAGLSMKRSLQRFLQKRNRRIQAASPYHSCP